MSDLAQLQQHFMALLQGTSDKLADHITEQGELNTNQRLSIYQNAYKIRLRAVIEQDHEQLGRYLGDDLFELMVQGYLQTFPSKFTSLRNFCDQLPQFLSTTEPFIQHPILAEIATFERMLLTAFDAMDAAHLRVEALESIAPENWPSLQLVLQPSVQLVCFNTNAVESWQALKEQQSPPEPQHQSSKCWVIARDLQRRTQYVYVDQQEFRLLSLIKNQTPFAQLCQSCLNELEPSLIAGFLIGKINSWLERGWLKQF
ncbi:DNA-binding domain-containing protein [Pseudoalteromonas neustonica]|uniref:DNA-binding domain-containing protein n=1 Tax=Pseudoalteromonas neustonica TaxID=1840331 RepID=A0ABU9U4A9_9GAMM